MFFLGLFFWGTLLIGGSFLVGIVIWLVRYLKNGSFDWKDMKWPFGCAGMMAAAIFGIVFVLPFLANAVGIGQTHDQDRYEEIFGYQPAITNERMISNHGGDGNARFIFLRAEVTSTEKARLLTTPGLSPSEITAESVLDAGHQRQFTWWSRIQDAESHRNCDQGEVYEATGFNSWKKLIVMDCPNSGDYASEYSYVYVIAEGRLDE